LQIEFSILATGLVDAKYTALGLITGAIYEFKVQSRNSYDYSEDSDIIVLLCGFKPE